MNILVLQDNEHLHDYSHTSNVLLVAFSLTDLSSLQYAKQIIALASNKMVSIVLVGTKEDLKSERQVSSEAILSLSNNLGCPYLETSAASGFNVHHPYQLAVNLELTELRKAQMTLSLEVEKKHKKRKLVSSLLRRWTSARQSKKNIKNSSITRSVRFISSL